MKILLLFTFATTCLAFTKSRLITFKSNKSFSETSKEVTSFISEKGLKLFAVIDHTKNAESVGLTLDNNKLFVFGNPKVGTPLMISNPEFGIDLPVKVLVFTKKNKGTFVSYNRPLKLRSKHSIARKHPSIKKMTKVLDLLKQRLSK